MRPADLARRYDAIAKAWDEAIGRSEYGLSYVRRALGFSRKSGMALDIGCGNGRLIDPLREAGFAVEALDISPRMLELAARRHPDARLILADICTWKPERFYDTIIAWDSIFHVPHSSQAPVVRELCEALAPGGVLLFTAGGTNGEITGEMLGESFYYSSLADDEYLRIVNEAGCRCLLLERDQHPEAHVVMICLKK